MENYLYKELYELEEKHWWFVSKREIVLFLIQRYLPNIKHNKILDIGCGSGLMLNTLQNFGAVYGIDSSEEALIYSAKNFEGELKKGFLPGGIPYPNNYFDLIIALDILEHIEDDITSITDIKKHLKSNGICIITVPAYMFLWSSHDIVHNHKRRYTLKLLQEKLLAENFKILKISYYNTILFFPILLVRTLNRLFKINNGSDAKMPNKYFNYLLNKIFSFEKYLINLINFKFGVSIIAVVRKNN